MRFSIMINQHHDPPKHLDPNTAALLYYYSYLCAILVFLRDILEMQIFSHILIIFVYNTYMPVLCGYMI